ncbi:hypothetical protein TRFO_37471 [Tritrichomonas foetus]|uniref:Uncharacterized protein n=1 Tax=Tritrichomonas foetus TaxID=1144522 RepID=A0A1J4JDN3_9EUKA|nr:hypothetical protein TRFO_37471 [Tritrichomonas foetus]|eukprot:OHS96399.1 hypothetical protein TRFO_37471 [Tritrichomonas foetus]
MSGKEEIPSADINENNEISRIEECLKYMTHQEWKKFNFLFPLIAKYQETRTKVGVKAQRDEDEFAMAWHTLRANAVDTMLKNLESAQEFDDFMIWMEKLSEIVTDTRILWNILHTETQTSLKVTAEQSRKIAEKFFSPEMLFEYGLDSYLHCCLCNLFDVKSEDEVVDAFYGAAGYIRACNIGPKYQIRVQPFLDFVEKILQSFTDLPNFDARRFVWLVEVIRQNLHIPDEELQKICQSVLSQFSEKQKQEENESIDNSLALLHKMCIISTSPFLHKEKILQDVINSTFKTVLQAQHEFTQNYIFSCFVNCVWNLEQATGRLSDPVIVWKLYLENTFSKIHKKKELPALLLVDLVDNSLSNFIGYYGEIQPSKERAKDMRRDIFTIVDLAQKFNQAQLGPDQLKKIRYLLNIAAVSGAQNDQLKNVEAEDYKNRNDPFLGLRHTECEFDDYPLALARLNKDFETEKDVFPSMVEFIRKNYRE